MLKIFKKVKDMTTLITTSNVAIVSGKEYIAGIIIAILILGYLVYALVKPEKF